MNNIILNIDVQDFIDDNIKSDITDLLLKGIHFKGVATKLIIEQIEAKKKAKNKLPTWFNTPQIYYPNKLNIEQTSSEITANYKANLVSGSQIIDLTGGFGIDAYYFAQKIDKVIHCELNSELSEIVKYNYKILNTTNIQCLNENGIEALKRLDCQFDWIYIDPSRRDDAKNKVFLLSDCTPNIKTFQNLFFKYAKNVMIKTSPLLDVKATLLDLAFVRTVHIIAVNNEVKELLWILERGYTQSVRIKATNITKTLTQNFEFNLEDESNTDAELSEPLTYLYEPNSALLKAGAFNSISELLNISKLHKHSHLYTSDLILDFPGRRFKIEKQLPFHKKTFAKEKITKANITTRNFPLSVHDIRKKLNVKDGGHNYLFFTTNVNNDKIILVCSKI